MSETHKSSTELNICIDTPYYVCIDAGDFDIILNESKTEFAAHEYLKRVQPISKNVKLEIKTSVRRLSQEFETDDILIGVSIKN
ncbi:hypothetical protein ACKUB1_17805 [Methanospirillum stamsii]|uniref:Uncharacterized protein n=1 Tax=Methanospirillum stamsii TaxID=1277351 RepID=A0A2V2MZN6_9EURY|nr:hypothetical protein [Methanospirillum stamsii]PWR73352.1 hypothetical protein DLD82_10825 [Methanospirillum stamsii]